MDRFTAPSLLLTLSLILLAPGLPAAAELADAPCWECHDKDPFAEGRVHPPVADGECEACHQDHGDQEKLILVEAVPALCWQCHDEFSKANKHDPVAGGDCLDCHDVHNAAQRKLLAKAVPALCEECHDRFEGAGSVHSPVADGECTECHGAHDSDQEALLAAGYDRERYVEFSEEAYALCFNCHDTASFAEPNGEGLTGFRDGARNLHYVHVYDREVDPDNTLRRNKKRRMSCDGCHLVHASEQARLIRPKLTKGKMDVYVIEYTPNETGGGCVVGCHKPREYNRKAAGQAAVVPPKAPRAD